MTERSTAVRRVLQPDDGDAARTPRFSIIMNVYNGEVYLRAAIDSVLAHRVLGLPIFFGAMYGLFWLTFTLGERPMGWIEAGFAWLSLGAVALLGSPESSLLSSLVVDGVIGR